MRSLKFRAWDKDLEHWVEDIDLTFGLVRETQSKVFMITNKSLPYDEMGTRYVLQQYTGLDDKQGKEIYEGDIVQHDDGDICEVEPIIPISNIKDDLISWANIDYKVIGNIYENPELLEDKSIV